MTGGDLSPRAVADETGLSLSFIRREIKRGHLRAYKVGGRVRVERQALEEWKRSNAVRPGDPPMYEPSRGRRSRRGPAGDSFTSEVRAIRGGAA